MLLVKPPYFSPWTPPLGIAILKSFLAQHGYFVQCYDFNADPELWGMHHKYFSILQTLEDVSVNDGYSKLWWILDAHMLAYANGADAAACARVLEVVVPLQGIRIEPAIIKLLLPLVEKFYRRLSEMTEQFDLASFDVIGTSTYTTSLGPSLFFLKQVKTKYPRIKSVMGGGAFADDLALGSDNLETLMREYDFVDHFVLGEGELLLLKLLQGEFADKRLISLADLKGSTLQMKDVPIPDFSDVRPESYYHLTIEGARSCPFQCSFCSETIQWGDYRKKPMADFADQVLELAKRYNNNSFFMGDSLMNPYINAFAGELLERRANILYDGYLRADKPVSNRKFVQMWADSGCYRVRLGIESAAARVLDSMDKMTTPQVISDVLKTFADAGIRTTTYWITGFPGETEADFQESCDFIRAHHQYIYELEAHAYYYYPYGQIGSRLHQCYSLYPDEVTDIIKFKVWEIINANPTRVERFDRLRRMSELASNLGLPNIYTMAERYEAEERWHRLYPLAAEVYDATRLQRNLPALPSHPVAPLVAAAPQASAAGSTQQAAALSYHMTHGKPLVDETLAAAAKLLAQHNEMLQLRCDNGQYVPASLTSESGAVLTLTPTEAERNDLPEFIQHTVAELAEQLRPEPPHSLRIVHIKNGAATSELLLVAHRALFDSRSLILLCEDLFRSYEQLAHNRALSLIPVQKTYTELIGELTAQDNNAVNASLAQLRAHGLNAADVSAKDTAHNVITLGPELTGRFFADPVKQYGLTQAEAMAAVLLRTVARLNAAHELTVDLTTDFRATNSELARTVGALTLTQRLPATLFDAAGPCGNMTRMKQAVQEMFALRVPPVEAQADATRTNVLLNLEYFIAGPWLGGGQWQAQGFVVNGTSSCGAYELEVVPLFSRTEIQVRLQYRATAQVERLVEQFTRMLVEEMRAVVEHCERYAAAQAFWLNEFDKDVPASNVESISIDVAGADERTTLLPCRVEPDVLATVGRACEVDPAVALLSAFGVLLSRLNGREDVVIATALGDESAPPVPLRLKPSWDLSFDGFAAQVREQVSRAGEHGAHALDILTHAAQGGHTHVKLPVCDVGYVAQGGAAEAALSTAHFSNRFAALPQLPELMLAATGSADELRVQLAYKQNRFEPAVLNDVIAHLAAILEQVAADASIKLGEIVLDDDRTTIDAPQTLAQDIFSFGPNL